jgi:glycosyltransferase involved in cell wall biosynthesis
MKLIIYMPALNEEKHIAEAISDLPRKVDGFSLIEYLVINDGSIDKTAEIARACGAQVISHKVNLGVGVAFQSAVQFVLEQGADVLVGIDADRQFDPSEIPMLVAPILNGQADMVLGNRFHRGMPGNMPPLRYWGNQQVAKLVNSISGLNLQDVSCGFRAYSREALLRINNFGKFTYTHETILSLAYQQTSIVEVPITVTYYPGRKSRVARSLWIYALQTSRIILNVLLDYRPMRVFGTFAAFCLLVGIALVLVLFAHYLLVGAFSPYKSLGFIGLGFAIFGVLSFLIALISDMLNRIRANQERILYELKRGRYGK